MRLALEKARDFKKSMEAVSVLVDEAEFVAPPAGLNLRAADPR